MLEHALDTLWRAREGKRLTRGAYQKLGLSGALSQRLDDLWSRLQPAQQREGRNLLVALVDIAEDVALSTRWRRRVEELRPSGNAKATAFDAVLDFLVNERLLVRGRQEKRAGVETAESAVDSRMVEIAHETLIRRWPRLQGWLKDEQQREQRAKVRKARLTAAGAVVVLLIMVALSGIAYYQREQARNAISQALEVDNEVVFTVDRELEPLAGTGPVRKKLLDRVEALQEKLQSASKDNESVHLLVATYFQRGDVALSHDDLKRARQEYEAALKLIETPAKADPSNAVLQRDLSVSYGNLAGVAQAGGDLKAARELFSKGLAITEALAKADPSNAVLQRDLSVSYNKLADVAQAGGDLKAAREFFSKELAIAEALAKTDPSNAGLQRDLSVSYERLAGVDIDNVATARSWIVQALALRRRAAQRDAGNLSVQLELARCEWLAGSIELKAGENGDARTHHDAAARLVDQLTARGYSQNPGVQKLKILLASRPR
jgi:tetratricopeptide (TPR) repeat protein